MLDDVRNQVVGSSWLIIKPVSQDLVKNPIAVGKLIEASPFKKFGINTVKTDKRNNIITVEINTTSEKDISSLLNIISLSGWSVKITKKNENRKTKAGVIAPVHQNVTEEELLQHLKVHNSSEQIDIIKTQRLNKKVDNQWVPSASVKIIFAGEVLPEAVTIMHSYYRIKPFVGLPLICYNCQRPGHIATNCTSKMRCLRCGDEHKKEQCTIQEEDFKCANCKGNHKSNSLNCSKYVEAKKIESLRANVNLSYADAREKVRNNEKKKNIQINLSAQSQNTDLHAPSTSTATNSYRDSVLRSNTRNTEPQDREQAALPENFWENLKKCIVEVVKSIKNSDSNEVLEEIVEVAIENNLKSLTVKGKRNINQVEENLNNPRVDDSKSNNLNIKKKKYDNLGGKSDKIPPDK